MRKPNSGGISKYSRHREKVKFSTAALHRKESKILEKIYWHLFTFITVDMDRIAQEKHKYIIIFEIGRIMMTLFKFYGFGTSQSRHVKFVVLELNIRINVTLPISRIVSKTGWKKMRKCENYKKWVFGNFEPLLYIGCSTYIA